MTRDFTEAPDRTRHTLTQKQRHRINVALEKVLIIHKDGESVDYAVGHSDQTVADAVGLTVPHIRYQRQQVFGKLRSRTDPLKPVNGTFDEVYHRLAAIEDFLTDELGWKKK